MLADFTIQIPVASLMGILLVMSALYGIRMAVRVKKAKEAVAHVGEILPLLRQDLKLLSERYDELAQKYHNVERELKEVVDRRDELIHDQKDKVRRWSEQTRNELTKKDAEIKRLTDLLSAAKKPEPPLEDYQENPSEACSRSFSRKRTVV